MVAFLKPGLLAAVEVLLPTAYHRAMALLNRRQLARAAGCGLVALVLRASLAFGMRRIVDDLGIEIDLPDNWVPIPRAEILEAGERALAAGATADWTTRAAWQPPPHLRWFSIPHLVLESRPAPGLPDAAPSIRHFAGRAGARTVHTHQARWLCNELELRLTLLAFDDRREAFEEWVSSLRAGPAVTRGADSRRRHAPWR